MGTAEEPTDRQMLSPCLVLAMISSANGFASLKAPRTYANSVNRDHVMSAIETPPTLPPTFVGEDGRGDGDDFLLVNVDPHERRGALALWQWQFEHFESQYN